MYREPASQISISISIREPASQISLGVSISISPNQTDLWSANYVRCKVKPNTSPLKSIGLPCSSLI